jgi:hypothetical protein
MFGCKAGLDKREPKWATNGDTMNLFNGRKHKRKGIEVGTRGCDFPFITCGLLVGLVTLWMIGSILSKMSGEGYTEVTRQNHAPNHASQ